MAGSADLATVANEILFTLALQDVIARVPGFAPRPIDDVALSTGTVMA